MLTALLVISIIVSVTASVTLGYLVYIGQKKIDIYEQWVLEFRNDVNNVYTQLQQLDDKQIFQKDDEVGVIFLDIVTLIEKLNTRIESDVKNQKENNQRF
jgi:hypothetical protein